MLNCFITMLIDMPSPFGSRYCFILLVFLSSFVSNGCSQEKSAQIPQAADRIRNEAESVWVEFIQLALDYKPLNLGQGFPDFAAPKYLVESLHNATKQVSSDSDYQKNVLTHQYTRSFGHPRLVRALQKYYNQFRAFSELQNEKEQILITVGAYEALFVSLMAFVQPGDQVILIDPAFDAYAPIVSMAGGQSVHVPLRQLNGTSGSSSEHFQLNSSELEARILEKKTSVLVLNTPNNPLGKMFSLEELQQIANLCIKHNLLVIADEVYEQFYYNSSEHLSIATLPGMWARTITIGSAGKTFSVTGWKIGWAFGPSHLLRYAQLVHQTAIYTVATPLQEALARAFEHEMQQLVSKSNSEELYWQGLRRDLLRKRDRMASILTRAKMRPVVPQGGYFMLADFTHLAQQFPEYKREGLVHKNGTINSNDYTFARWLSRVKHLQGIPASAFYSGDNKRLAENMIRFCFIKSDDTLDKLEQLINVLVGNY